MQKICWTAFPVLLALAPASYAQSIGYEEALRAAVSEQPQVRARELQLYQILASALGFRTFR